MDVSNFSNQHMSSNQEETSIPHHLKDFQHFYQKNDLYCLFKKLIKTEEDLTQFMVLYHRNHQRLYQALLQIREMKLGSQSIDFENFTKMYFQDKQNALASLFQQNISERDVTYVEDKMQRKNITLRDIYLNHCNNPNLNLYRCIKKNS